MGEDEWKVHKHGVGKRRSWRKLHLGVDAESRDILAAELTSETITDGEVFPELSDQLGEQPLGQALGDGSAYDQKPCDAAILKRGGVPVIPPRKDAVE